MISKIKIFNCESEFRKYIIKNFINIDNIIIFEDIYENTIFFYAFNKDIIIATKEKENFDKYIEIYNIFAKKYNFDILTNKDYSIKLIKHQ